MIELKNNENNRDNGFQYKNPSGKPMSKESYENWVLTYDFPEIYNKDGKIKSLFVQYTPSKYNGETYTESKVEIYEGMSKEDFFDYERNQAKSRELLEKFGTDKDRDDLKRHNYVGDWNYQDYRLDYLSHNEVSFDDEIIEAYQYENEELLNKIYNGMANENINGKDYVCGNTLYLPNVKYIGKMAFGGQEGLTAIYIENNNVKIEEAAFAHCHGLMHCHLSEQMTKLPTSLFEGDHNLGRLKLPQELEKIGDYTFAGCTNLNFIHIPHGVKEIGNYAFADCDRIIDISFRFNNKLEKIGNYAFANVGSESQPLVIDFPDTLREIGECAFENANIGYISMTENTVKSIDINKVFKGLEISIEEIRNTIDELDRTKIISGIGRYFVIEEGNTKVELHIDDFEKFKESVIPIDLNNSDECITFEDMMKHFFLDYDYGRYLYNISDRTKILNCTIDKVKEAILKSDTEETFIKSLIIDEV